MDEVWQRDELGQYAGYSWYPVLVIFLPIGMLMRLLDKDSMHRKLDKTLSSYRVISQNENKDNVERPY